MQSHNYVAQIETIAREKLAATLDFFISAQDIQLQTSMNDVYGLTSLNKIVFILSLCKEVKIDLSTLTEDSLANMNTLEDVINILSDSTIKMEK